MLEPFFVVFSFMLPNLPILLILPYMEIFLLKIPMVPSTTKNWKNFNNSQILDSILRLLKFKIGNLRAPRNLCCKYDSLHARNWKFSSNFVKLKWNKIKNVINGFYPLFSGLFSCYRFFFRYSLNLVFCYWYTVSSPNSRHRGQFWEFSWNYSLHSWHMPKILSDPNYCDDLRN